MAIIAYTCICRGDELKISISKPCHFDLCGFIMGASPGFWPFSAKG